MTIHTQPIKTYRWITFLLAGGYCLYQVTTADYSNAGGPFRFLTIWALFASFYSASRMLALTEHRITQRHEVTATVAAVLNVMVVYLYWRLYFTDPALVNGGGPIAWHQEYYLHALGPALQIFDALFIARAPRRWLRTILPLVGLVAAYVAWAELFVQRFNDVPTGRVTSGLPYPFLNNMELPERAVFYASNVGMALATLGVLAALTWGIGRLAPRPASSEV